MNRSKVRQAVAGYADGLLDAEEAVYAVGLALLEPDDPVTVVLTLDRHDARLLAAVAEAYLEPGGPAWECAPEWDSPDGGPYTAAGVESLGRAVRIAVAGALVRDPE